ncbi:MAG TPA: RluA family pseudouridine synthase [Candidatus Angelobacter sp.]|nr:RluA family pseudouridine synthase [Candidatus Angelobacter sp.]
MTKPVGVFIRLSAPETREFWRIPILWEDEHLLVLDKPSGLLTSPDRREPLRPNLMKLLHRDIARGASWARERHLTYLANAHRLDLETSGVLLLARHKSALAALAAQFDAGKPAITHVALVQGAPAGNAFEIDARLSPHPAHPGLMRVDSRQGKKARTLFEVSERFSRYALLTCRPLSGRTHQVRAHLRHAGLPVVGDRLYGGAPLLLSRLKSGYRLKPGHEERPLIDRAAVHAERLDVTHPVSGSGVMIAAPWPKDLIVGVKYLRRYAADA